LKRQPLKDSDDKVITAFTCKICDKEGKYKDGAYICVLCKFYMHEKCANFDPSAVF